MEIGRQGRAVRIVLQDEHGRRGAVRADVDSYYGVAVWRGGRGPLCFFFQAEDGIRDVAVTGVQTCALPISSVGAASALSTMLINPLSADATFGSGSGSLPGSASPNNPNPPSPSGGTIASNF